MINSDTIIALATPPGIGAISIIRISGKNAISVSEKLFFTNSTVLCVSNPEHRIISKFLKLLKHKLLLEHYLKDY